jgi:hypothetical protein
MMMGGLGLLISDQLEKMYPVAQPEDSLNNFEAKDVV